MSSYRKRRTIQLATLTPRHMSMNPHLHYWWSYSVVYLVFSVILKNILCSFWHILSSLLCFCHVLGPGYDRVEDVSSWLLVMVLVLLLSELKARVSDRERALESLNGTVCISPRTLKTYCFHLDNFTDAPSMSRDPGRARLTLSQPEENSIKEEKVVVFSSRSTAKSVVLMSLLSMGVAVMWITIRRLATEYLHWRHRCVMLWSLWGEWGKKWVQ